MSDSDKTSNLSTHQNRNCQKSLCPFSLQIFAPLAVHARISLNVFANYGARREKQFLNGWVVFPKPRILREWMLWVRRRQFSADRKSTRLNSSHVAISYAVF